MAKMILDMPDQTERTLQALASEQHVSVGGLLRPAVSLHQFALDNTDPRRLNLALTSADGRVETIIDPREDARASRSTVAVAGQ